VADTPLPENEREKAAPNAGYGNLRPIKPGEVRNKAGTNRWKKAQARLAKFMMEYDPDHPDQRRLDSVLRASFESALVVGLKGAPDRKLLIEQTVGRARQQLDLSNQDGTLQPVRADAILSALQSAIAARKADAEDEQAATMEAPGDGHPVE